MSNLGFIGVGNMASAIITSVFKSSLNVKMFAYDIDPKKLANVQKLNVNVTLNYAEICECSDYLFLVVKPQSFTEVLAEIKPFVSQNTVIVSIAAGITADFIAEKLGFTPKLVRVMPNTPLLVGEGATALATTPEVSGEELQFVNSIFSQAGKTAIIGMDKMNEIIAINGSTPAFIYEFARCFIEYGESVGLDSAVCLNLFSQTLIGSAAMMMTSGHTISELIDMVSSKGGTTVAGLASLREDNLQGIISNACKKCVARAYELSE